MRRFVRMALLALLGWLLAAMGQAHAQEAPDLDALLQWQDAMVLRRYQSTYVSDKRYDGILRRISERLNPHLAEVFPHPRPVRYYVFLGRMGFNAQTWNGIIIFDSLLIDTLRKLAEGVAVYGTTDCDYVRALAMSVAQIDRACRAGRLMLGASNPDNPYRLPTLWGLTPAQRERADALFEEMLASWMAHEGSHAFLDHTRERVEAQRLLWLYNQQGQAPPEMVRQYIAQYLGSSTTLQKEREADEYGIRLTLRCGYMVDGLIRSLELAHFLEQLNGEAHVAQRTHPTPADRIVMARQIANEVAPRPDGQKPPAAPR